MDHVMQQLFLTMNEVLLIKKAEETVDRCSPLLCIQVILRAGPTTMVLNPLTFNSRLEAQCYRYAMLSIVLYILH